MVGVDALQDRIMADVVREPGAFVRRRLELAGPDGTDVELLLPRTFRAVGWCHLEAAAPGVFQRLASFDGPDGSGLDLGAIAIDRDVDASVWLDLTLRAHGHQVEALERIEGLVPAGVARSTRGRDPRTSWWACLQDGARLIVVQAFAPTSSPEALLDAERAVRTAQVESSAPSPYVKPLRSLEVRLPASLLLEWPASFFLVANEEPGTRFDATLARIEHGTAVGAMHLSVAADGDALEAEAWEWLAAQGFTEAGPTERDREPGPTWTRGSGAEEATLDRLVRDDASVTILARGPSRAAAAPLWATNRRARDILLRGLERTGDGLGSGSSGARVR